MVLYVRFGDLIRDFGHTYSAERAFKGGYQGWLPSRSFNSGLLARHLKQSLGKYSMDDIKAARAVIKCWCKIVISAAVKKRRDDVVYVPIFYLFPKAGFPPYLVSLFV
jgi:hypothetical protein